MKKITKVLSALLFLASLTSCGSNPGSDPGKDPNPVVNPTEEEKAATAKLSAKTSAEAAYISDSSDASYDDQVTIDIAYQALLKDIDALTGTAEAITSAANTLIATFKEVASNAKATFASFNAQKEAALKELKDLYDNSSKLVSETTKTELTALYNEVKTDVTNATSDISGILKAFKAELYEKASEHISLKLEDVKKLFIDNFNYYVEKVNETIDSTDTALVNEINTLVNNIKTNINNYQNLANLKNNIKTIKTAYKAMLKEKIDAAIAIFKETFNTELEALKELRDTYINDEVIKAKFDEYMAEIDNFTNHKEYKDFVEDKISETKTYIEENITSIYNSYKTKVESTYNELLSYFNENVTNNTLLNAVKDKINDFKNVVVPTTIDQLKTKLDLLESKAKIIKEILETNLATFIKDIKDAAKDKIDEIYDTYKDYITDATLKTDIDNLVSSIKTSIDDINTLKDISTNLETLYKSLKDKAVEYINKEI